MPERRTISENRPLHKYLISVLALAIAVTMRNFECNFVTCNKIVRTIHFSQLQYEARRLITLIIWFIFYLVIMNFFLYRVLQLIKMNLGAGMHTWGRFSCIQTDFLLKNCPHTATFELSLLSACLTETYTFALLFEAFAIFTEDFVSAIS